MRQSVYFCLFLVGSLLPVALLVQTPPPTPPPSGQTVAIPKTIAGAAGDLIPVKADSGAELVSWDATPGLSIVTHVNAPPDPAQKTVNIHAAVDGQYALTASVPDGKVTHVSICLVTIGPRPPPPIPVPPQPPTFQENLQAAFVKDGATLDQTSKLAALYRVASTTTVQDQTLKTTGDLLAEMQRAVKNLGLPAGSLNNTARVIADELNKTFAANVPLTPALRTQIGVAFQKVAISLEALK